MRTLALSAFVALFVCLAGHHAPARAAEIFVSGYTNGCFNCGTSVPDSSAAQTDAFGPLQYVNSTFSGTTANSGLALNAVAQAPPTQNTNNLGAFQLPPVPFSYNGQTFSLRVAFTAPQGIASSNPVLLTASITGTVQSNGTGRVTINFDNTPVALTYNDTNCEGDPATTCGSGQFYLRVEDVGINAGQTVAVRGRVFTVRPAAAGEVLISEFRMSGPAGACDDYVELYNNTDSERSVFGYTLFFGSSNGNTAFPAGTLAASLAPRQHLLVAGNAYSLNSSAPPDAPLGNCSAAATAAVGLFNGDLATANRIDGVTFSDTPANSGIQFTFAEGMPLQQTGASASEHAWVRDASNNARPQDTNNNAADFMLVSTAGGAVGSVQSRLGAPGPESLASPLERNAQLTASYLDNAQCATCEPNRARDANAYVDTLTNPSTPATFNLGRLIIRRTFTNTTQSPVTRLRFRVIDITTLNTPNIVGGVAQADIRALSSPDESVNTSGGPVLARGLRLEAPSTGAERGGWNSSLSLDFVTPTAPAAGASEVSLASADDGGGTLNLSAPLQPGDSISVQFWFGVVQGGRFRVFVSVEALP